MTDKNNNEKNSYIGYGVGFGLLGGAIFSSLIGMFFDSTLIWAFGPGIGMMIGIVIGTIMDYNNNTK